MHSPIRNLSLGARVEDKYMVPWSLSVSAETAGCDRYGKKAADNRASGL